jgi:hypothetical protein
VNYLIRLGDALSQLLNVIFLNGHPNESISGRAWRTQSRWRFVIDTIFWFDQDHCKTSHENDLAYALELLK